MSSFCDDAAASVAGLAHGDFGRFAEQQPTAGPFSIILRAPVAALAQLGSDSTLAQYRLGAFACLLATGLLILWLAHAAHRRGVHPVICALFAAGVMVNPLTLRALELGHPEEPLGALLVVAALVTASERRAVAAGLLLGAAMATKQWALLAAGPVLLAAAPPVRRPAALAAILTAAVIYAPAAIGAPDRFRSALETAASPNASATPTNVWWPLAEVDRSARVLPGTERRAPPQAVKDVSHWLVLALAFGGAAAMLAAAREPGLQAALALTALIFLLRCVLDPYTFSYHHWPFFAALAAYEVVGRGRLPWLAAGACFLLWVTSYHVAPGGHADPLMRFYLGWTLPLTGILAWITVRETRAVRAQALSGRRRLARPC